MKVVQFKNIKPDKRVCCDCGLKFYGRCWSYVQSPERGKYLCPYCRRKREEAQHANQANPAIKATVPVE